MEEENTKPAADEEIADDSTGQTQPVSSPIFLGNIRPDFWDESFI